MCLASAHNMLVANVVRKSLYEHTETAEMSSSPNRLSKIFVTKGLVILPFSPGALSGLYLFQLP